MTQKGVVYAVVNEYINSPGPNSVPLYKIGMTNTIDRLEKRISELSTSTGVPGNYQIKFAIITNNPIEAEKKIHKIVSTNFTRCPKKEFWNVPYELIRPNFQLYIELIENMAEWYYIDGVKISNTSIEKQQSIVNVDILKSKKMKENDMSKYLEDGLELQCVMRNTKWMGTYNKRINKIIISDKDGVKCNVEYNSPSGLVKEQLFVTGLSYNTNGWRIIEYKDDNGKWWKIDTLKKV